MVRRLVEEQQVRPRGQRQCQIQASALSHGQLSDSSAEFRRAEQPEGREANGLRGGEDARGDERILVGGEEFAGPAVERQS